MAKVGTHHKTTAFGDASEYYASRLFRMERNPNGNIRPDLVVNPELRNYSDQFSIELKGGKRAILLKSQLAYGINDIGTWKEFFGRTKRNPFAKNGQTTLFVNEGERVFYGMVRRVDGLSPDDLVGDYAMVRLQWGDFYLIPSELVFHYYASVLSRKNCQRIGRVEDSLRKFVARAVKSRSSLYDERDNDSWVSMPFSSAKAIFEGEVNGVRNEDQKQTLQKFFRVASENTDYDNYKRKVISAIGENKLYVLYDEKRDERIVEQVVSTVRKARPLLDIVDEERREAKEWMEKEGVKIGVRGFDHYHNGGVDEERRRQIIQFYGERHGIDDEKIDLLERLCKWETFEEYESRVSRENAERENLAAGVPF
jgi:hypothetical protein